MMYKTVSLNKRHDERMFDGMVAAVHYAREQYDRVDVHYITPCGGWRVVWSREPEYRDQRFRYVRM